MVFAVSCSLLLSLWLSLSLLSGFVATEKWGDERRNQSSIDFDNYNEDSTINELLKTTMTTTSRTTTTKTTTTTLIENEKRDPVVFPLKKAPKPESVFHSLTNLRDGLFRRIAERIRSCACLIGGKSWALCRAVFRCFFGAFS